MRYKGLKTLVVVTGQPINGITSEARAYRAHARGLKVYLDEEFQYVAEGHPWWRESIGRPHAKYADYLLWRDPEHRTAEPFLDHATWAGYDGRQIGIAMVATLYGVGFANLVFLPVGNRLKKLSEEELRVRQLMIDVIVAIQEGAKPEFIRERLRVSLPPDLRRSIAVKSRVKAKRQATAPLPQQQPMDDEMYATVPEEQY